MKRHIEVKASAYGEDGELLQETIFRQYFNTKEQQVKEQSALFPAVAKTVQETMQEQE